MIFLTNLKITALKLRDEIMSAPKLVTIHERLGWADRQLKQAIHLAQECADAICTLGTKQDGNKLTIFVENLKPYPREFSFLLGDAAHNIRSALDNLAFAIAKPSNKKERDAIYFPIYENQKVFEEYAPRNLPGITNKVLLEFEAIQPYHSKIVIGAEYLSALKSLNNWDKHKEIAICCVNSKGVGFLPEIQGAHKILDTQINNGLLAEGKIIAVMTLTSAEGFSDIDLNAHLSIAPIFDTQMPKVLQGHLPLEVLHKAMWYVERTVVPRLREFL